MRTRQNQSVKAVVMAGGLGQRLHQLTENQPKPMLRIGQDPLLGIIVKQLRSAAITQILIATHYKTQAISSYFGDGTKFGVHIEYLFEESPLGTAGCLASIESTDDNIVVVNGDILTGLDFNALLAFHEAQGADMTVAVKALDVSLAYGVVQTDGLVIKNLVEKPTYTYQINAGIYVLSSAVCQYVKKGCATSMTSLIQLLIEKNRPVACYTVQADWIDIGTPEDYERAIRDFKHIYEDKIAL